MCEAFESARDIGPTVTITVENQSGGPVWLATTIEMWGCAPLPVVAIADAEGAAVEYLTEACEPWDCASLMKLSDCSSVCHSCGVPDWGRLDDGVSAVVNWPGVWLTALEMPAACASGTMCQRACKRIDQAPAGLYTLEVVAYHACTGDCTCVEKDQFCPVHAWDLTEPVSTTVQLDYPAQTAVTVVLPSPA